MPVLRCVAAISLSVLATALATIAEADPLQPARVIEITRQNAERSAAAIAAAPSPFIGEPPQGKLVRNPPQVQTGLAAASEDKPDAVTQSIRPAASQIVSDQAIVRIIRPGQSIVEVHVVPRHDAVR